MLRVWWRSIRSPFEFFFRLEAAGSIVLFGAAVAAMVLANSAADGHYFRALDWRLGFEAGGFALQKPLLLWINDGLMAVFFLAVGLEIKRELLGGELSTRRSAALPVAAAIGGMVVPASIYWILNRGTDAVRGWGIPMATDIAFALGALALLGRRLPPGLRILLAATAIVDDIGAVLVIAVFYTPELHLAPLAGAVGVLAILLLLNRAGVRRLAPYLLLGLVLWVAVLKSGVHATVAGVALAMTIPDAVRGPARPGDTRPLVRLEHALLPVVTFGIMPVFALANAGVRLDEPLMQVLRSPVAAGIFFGLVLGKQVGLLLAPWAAVRARWAQLPAGVTWTHLWGMSWLGGIGFTMSIFITGLALDPAEEPRAKLAILVASLVAGVGGVAVLWLASKRSKQAARGLQPPGAKGAAPDEGPAGPA